MKKNFLIATCCKVALLLGSVFFVNCAKDHSKCTDTIETRIDEKGNEVLVKKHACK